MTRWQRFGHWRRTRPFWAGVFLIGSGLVILIPSYATLRLGDLAVSISTLGGASALLIGVMLIVIGISVWIRPQFRLPAGIAAGLLALVSLPAANLGGLIVGMLLGLVGAALAISWSDHPRAGALLLVALAVGTALGNAPQPAAGASLVGHAPSPTEKGTAEKGTAESCLPPRPDRARAPTAGAPSLAVAPFRLDASRLDLHQVDLANSNKIVSVPTRQGSKRVLKFVADAAEITDLRLTTAADGAASLTLSTPAGSRTRLIGPITLYLEKLCGTLAAGPLGVGFGVPGALLPPLSAASPPPLAPPEVTFTGVTVYTAGLVGAQLEVPGLLLTAGGG